MGVEPNVPLRKRNAMKLLNEGALAQAMTNTERVREAQR
jgi:hypothetical protein